MTAMDARTQTAADVASNGSAANQTGARRRLLFTLLGAVIAIGAVLYFIYWLLVASHQVATDDAYINADVAQVTPQVAGSIIAAPITDTKLVKKGDVLVVIDPADYKLALAQAKASLDQTRRQVEGDFANNDAQTAVTAARDADVGKAQAQLASAKADEARTVTDLQRRKALAPAGAVSGDELTAAQDKYDQAHQAVAAAQAALLTAQAEKTAAVGQQKVVNALITGAGVTDNPQVAVAQAKVDQAQLDLDRTTVRSPVDGVIAKNNIEVGQRVPVGADLMTVVPIESAYVNANFKEGQLRHVRIGQPVVLTSDLYGKSVKFHGRVVGVSGGTGAAFAVIPAQNATGNWIKVVQRLPVRIALDPAELSKHPLRVGLSMDVDIDTSK
jgi:membrane fusion protein, multidrug efflux system